MGLHWFLSKVPMGLCNCIRIHTHIYIYTYNTCTYSFYLHVVTTVRLLRRSQWILHFGGLSKRCRSLLRNSIMYTYWDVKRILYIHALNYDRSIWLSDSLDPSISPAEEISSSPAEEVQVSPEKEMLIVLLFFRLLPPACIPRGQRY